MKSGTALGGKRPHWGHSWWWVILVMRAVAVDTIPLQMFMPMCNSARRQEHQKRPPSGKPANRPPSASKDLTELIEWAQSDDVNVQFQAARSLADLAIAEFARDSIRTLGGIPPLIRLLSSDMIEVQRCVVTAIANLALSEENQALFAKEGEVVLVPLISIAASVCNEAEEEEMQLNVARALANMAYCNADIEQKLVELGCLSPLMTLCERGSPEVRLEAVAALANLARHEANQRKIVEHGALLHLVAAMRLPEEEELLKQAARCLANISLNIQNEKEVKVRKPVQTHCVHLSWVSQPASGKGDAFLVVRAGERGYQCLDIASAESEPRGEAPCDNGPGKHVPVHRHAGQDCFGGGPSRNL